jgi:protein-tyrosine kinase
MVEVDAMSRIDDALRRARGEADPDTARPQEAEAPWEFSAQPTPVTPPAPGWPDPPTTAALEPEAPRVGALPQDGLFVSLEGDEKLVGAGLRQAAVEEYRKLSASLHEAQGDRGMQVVIVASAVPGEGKSLTAANLALTLTTSYSRRVLLIDADLRRPSLHALFRIPVTSGLSEGLDASSGAQVSAVQLSPLLALLPAGRPVENPVPLLTSDRMAALIRDARQHFDWVIVDTPPVGLLTDANLLTRESDTALLVIHANRTPYALVQKAIQAIGKAKIFGVVMNRLEEHIHLTGSTYTGYSGYYRDYLKGGK